MIGRTVLGFVVLLAPVPAMADELACETPAWRMVYRHDADGNPMAGTKQALFDAIRRGDAIRFAWGSTFEQPDGTVLSVEHTAEPVFLTIVGGEKVVVQLPEHIAQESYPRPEGDRFKTASVMWRGLMTTEGRFDAVWVDRASGEEVLRKPQRVGLSWFAFAPDPACDPRPILEIAVPGGVRSDTPEG